MAQSRGIASVTISKDELVLTASTILSSAAGDVTFGQTVDGDGLGPWDLTINSPGTTAFEGAVGGVPLASLMTDMAGTTDLNGGTVDTVGSQTYEDAVVLTAR